MAEIKPEAIQKAEGDATVTDTVVPPQSIRSLRTFGSENEVNPPVDPTGSTVPGQVFSSAEPDVEPSQLDTPSQGQGPPPQKAPALPSPCDANDLQWQRHQQHLAYLKSLGSEAYRMAVEDTEGGLSPVPAAKEIEVDDTTVTPTSEGPALLQCLSVDVKHLFDEKDDYTRETSMVEAHCDEAISEVIPEEHLERKAQTTSPRPLTTPGRGVREVKIDPSRAPTTVENWSQVEDRQIWDKLRAQLQSLEDSVGELTKKTMPKPRPKLGDTQSHPSWPKDAGMTFFTRLPRTSCPPVVQSSLRSYETLSENSSSEVSSSKGLCSVASVQQGSFEPEIKAPRNAGCMPPSCSSSHQSLPSPQLPSPCSAKIMTLPMEIGTPSVGARTPGMVSPGRSLVYRQISSPVVLLTPRIRDGDRIIVPSGYPQ